MNFESMEFGTCGTGFEHGGKNDIIKQMEKFELIRNSNEKDDL